MRTICLPLLLASCIFFFDSCQVCSCKKVPCPAFNEPQFTDWFPYSSDQKIIFRNTSLTDTITIGPVQNSESYEANKGCSRPDIGCYMDYQIYSWERLPNSTPRFNVWFRAQTPFESSVTTKNITLQFYNFLCVASGINSGGLELAAGIYSSKYYASLNIAGNVYSNVQVITKDTTSVANKTGGVYKIFLAQNQGMIGYDDYPALTTWIKQ